VREIVLKSTRREYPQIRKDQIIAGALKAFAEHGYEKATNKHIAVAAGIRSPGLIYHYFRDKRDLLDQILQTRVPVFKLLVTAEGLMSMPPRDVLTSFGRAFLEVLEKSDETGFMRVMFGEAARNPEFGEMYGRSGPHKAFAFLSTYLAGQMDAGTLRRADPAAAARCFLGPLLAYVLARVIFMSPDSVELDRETMVLTNVDIFLKGLEAV
jgi:AcrR family transcriptional regulator